MKIKRVRAVHFDKLQTTTPGWKISIGARKPHDRTVIICVRVDTDEGLFGLGTSSPGLIVISGETVGYHLDLINNVLGPAIAGMDPFDIESIHLSMDLAAAKGERAKAAVDLAVYDLMGKALNVPVIKLLGGIVNESVRVTRLMGLYDPKEMAERTKVIVEEGCTALKLKVGTTLQEDVERVQRVREAVGPDVIITIDFNQACTPKEAIERLNKMEPCHIAIAEQPVKREDFNGLAAVRRNVSTLVMADECVNTPAETMRVIETGAADVVSLKWPKMGGLYKCKKIAAICEAAEIDYLVGTCGNNRLAGAAAIHLAASLKNLSLPCELGEFERFRNDPSSGLDVNAGFLTVPKKPGLGVDVDLKAVGLAD
jgi:L-alanine-DL-glutamate epimerase-like enolase superfamily enzyme